MSKLRLMSHNQWKYDNNSPRWAEQGLDCSAAVRAKGFARVYADTRPDIIGCQEVSGLMAERMLCELQEAGLHYALLWGRDTPIVYRPDRLELVDSDFLIYPEAAPGLQGAFNNDLTKSFNVGVFRDKTDGKLLIFMTTHLWWKSGDPSSPHFQAGSDEARTYQLSLAVAKIDAYAARYACPAVLVGDLNANYDAPGIRYVLSQGFVHAHDVAAEFADETQGYHRLDPEGYGPYLDGPFRSAIDHILVRGAKAGAVRRFERFSPDYYLPLSDHSPVFADLEL